MIKDQVPDVHRVFRPGGDDTAGAGGAVPNARQIRGGPTMTLICYVFHSFRRERFVY